MNNCPNCGAPLEPYKYKCEYCGTYYYDLTAFDMSGDKTYYVKFKTNYMGQNAVITALAKPYLDTVEVNQDTTDITDRNGNIIRKIGSMHCDMNVRFQCYIDNQTKSLFQISYD